MARFYRYIHVSDDGHAPCVDHGLITLATCKPQIRSTAKVGDWVAGYMPKGIGEGLVTWIGRVAEAVSPTDYERRFRGRKDAQYRLLDDGHVKRVDPAYHPGIAEQRKDMSAKVLIFDQNASWYFGDRPIELPSMFGVLAASGQGHRVNLRLPDDIAQIEAWLHGQVVAGVHGDPRDGAGCGTPCSITPPRAQKRQSGGC